MTRKTGANSFNWSLEILTMGGQGSELHMSNCNAFPIGLSILRTLGLNLQLELCQPQVVENWDLRKGDLLVSVFEQPRGRPSGMA